MLLCIQLTLYLSQDLDFFTYLECLVMGQERKECASHPSCHRTCDKLGGGACPQICIINGCECPTGTVVDEDENKCIAPSECKGLCKDVSVLDCNINT